MEIASGWSFPCHQSAEKLQSGSLKRKFFQRLTSDCTSFRLVLFDQFQRCCWYGSQFFSACSLGCRFLSAWLLSLRIKPLLSEDLPWGVSHAILLQASLIPAVAIKWLVSLTSLWLAIVKNLALLEVSFDFVLKIRLLLLIFEFRAFLVFPFPKPFQYDGALLPDLWVSWQLYLSRDLFHLEAEPKVSIIPFRILIRLLFACLP